ncbi:NAD-dependent epimerase/dehydratase family protein [Phytoactinopolyspora sp. XMNu-373]|uniref:NAD-dependent epimerase/dehydratase family protein n=1 Tax=Phytoactinopolyspora mesophila TaxID=2650750 RepID=A0A7K3M9I4_9ACTN|nr:NAD-dependent epimerase/dehydratase family protein [Phytoactinopolyspora mesophila]
MRALITGGAGFVGGHLAERLLADGHQVTALDDLSTGSRANIEHLEDRPGFAFVRGSILDERLMDALVSRSDVVFHLAAAVGVELILARALEGIRTNVHGTEIVLECAYRHRTRTLIASTSEIYGKNPAATLSETQDRVVGSPQVRRWSYAEAKALDETMAFLYWAELGVPTVIARLFNVAGPRQTGRYGMVIPRFVSQAINGEPLTVYGDGQQTRSFCHVSDAVEGLVALVADPATYGQAFNIGRPEEVTIQHLAERVIALSGSPSAIRRIRYEDAYGAGFEDTMRRVPDISRARNTVGFDPQRNLDDIIRSVIQDQLTAALRVNGDRPVPVVAGFAGDSDVW